MAGIESDSGDCIAAALESLDVICIEIVGGDVAIQGRAGEGFSVCVEAEVSDCGAVFLEVFNLEKREIKVRI